MFTQFVFYYIALLVTYSMGRDLKINKWNASSKINSLTFDLLFTKSTSKQVSYTVIPWDTSARHTSIPRYEHVFQQFFALKYE